MIHIDKSGDKEYTIFFGKIAYYEIAYVVIGHSYYPWWHGNLLQLRECLNLSALNYNKHVVLVEVAYNFQPQEYIDKTLPFPESPSGQKEFYEAVYDIILNIPITRVKVYFGGGSSS